MPLPKVVLMRKTVEMPIDLQVDAATSVSFETLESRIHACQRALDQSLGDARLGFDLCVRICEEAESAQLNGDFRNKPYATNVLSFPADVDLPEGAPVLGDLALCWPVLQREALAQNKTVLNHFSHLYVHGVLHLLGFDHVTDDGAQEMEAIEIQALQRLAIANPYIRCD
jgi:probable rRNA maturation factor